MGLLSYISLTAKEHGFYLSLDQAITEKIIDTIFIAQVTFAAIIYPIVIAFVGIIFKSRANIARLKIYLTYSTARLSGLLSIFLTIFMTFQYLFSLWITPEVNAEYGLIDTFWFLINLTLTIYFLYQTFEFLDYEKQIAAIKYYVLKFVDRDSKAVSLENILEDLQDDALFSLENRRQNAFRESVQTLNEILISSIKLKNSRSEYSTKNIRCYKKIFRNLKSISLSIHVNEYILHLIKCKQYENEEQLTTKLSYYKNIFLHSASALKTYDIFFTISAYIPMSLISELKKAHPEMLRPIIDLQIILFYILQKQAGKNKKNLDSSTYKDALSQYIGGWEYIAKLLQPKGDEWLHYNMMSGFITYHFNTTLQFLLSTINKNDLLAYEVIENSISQWIETSLLDQSPNYFIKHSCLVSTELTKTTWEEVQKSYIDTTTPENFKPTKLQFFSVSIQHYWVDTILVTLCFLFHRNKIISNPDDLMIKAATKILDDLRSKLKTGSHFKKILSAWIRQRAGSVMKIHSDYYSKIDSLLNRFAECTMEKMIPGRSYSLPTFDLSYLQEEQLILFFLFFDSNYYLDDDIKESLLLISQEIEKKNRLSNQLNNLLKTFEKIDFDTWSNLFLILSNAKTIEEAKNKFLAGKTHTEIIIKNLLGILNQPANMPPIKTLESAELDN